MPLPTLDDRPRVTIVTPSLNQGRYLRHALDSVLGQDYPRLESVVVDGGSSDGSLEVLRSYGERISWISEPDRGQSDALNKGFRRARGEILAWLNADDELAPGAVGRAVETLRARPEAGLVYGRGEILDEDGRVMRPFAEIEPFSLWRLLHYLDYVLQPATFFRAAALERAGPLDERLCWAMDWDLWIRLAAEAEVVFVDEVLGRSREYGATKTATGGWRRVRELGRLARRHTERFWTPGVRMYALDTLGRRFPGRRTAAIVGRLARRVATRLAAYPDGWLGPRGRLVVPRRWGGVSAVLEAHRLPEGRPLVVRIDGGGTVEQVRFEAPGRRAWSRRWPSAADGGPFVEIALESDFAFTSEQDPRLLSIRCVEVGPDGAGVEI